MFAPGEKTDDESMWLQRLDLHIHNNINPLTSSSSSSSITCEDVITALPSHMQPHLLAELEIVTIKHLTSKISSSFTARAVHDGDYEDRLCMGSESPEILPEILPELPVFLLAVLKSSIVSSTGNSSSEDYSYEGLVLADKTGHIPCEVSLTRLPVGGIDHVILVPTQWNLIYSELSKSPTYLELQEVIIVDYHRNEVHNHLLDQAITFSVASFKDYIQSCKDQSKPIIYPLVDITGVISAVSDVIRWDLLFLVRLTDECDAELSITIFIKVPSLLHLSSLLRISERYLFTSLELKLIHKGSTQEMMVLSSTKETLISPTSCPSSPTLVHPSEISPSRKRIKISRQPISSSVSTRGTTSCYSSLQHHRHPHQEQLISYQGTITDCLYPSAGVYELDGRVHLYLTHSACSNLGRGLRSGVAIQLNNVYVLRVTAAAFKLCYQGQLLHNFPSNYLQHISGFFCCSMSNLRIIEFSPRNSPYVSFFSRNKLITLVRGYGLMDTAWILETFITLIDRDIHRNTRNCFYCLQELCKMSTDLVPFHGDYITEFTTGLAEDYLQKETDLSMYPLTPSVAAFKEAITKRIDKEEEFTWCKGKEREEGGQSSGMSANVAYVIRTEWMYGLVRASELEHRQILIGELLHGSMNSGLLVLQDQTGSLPVVPIMPMCSEHTNLSEILISQSNRKIIVSDFLVILEKTITHDMSERTSSDLQISLHPVVFKTVPLSPPQKSPGDRRKHRVSELYPSFLIGAGDESDVISVLYFRVLNKNIARINALQRCEFTCQVLIHTDPSSLHVYCKTTGETPESRPEREMLKIAVLFAGDCFKWFYLISNNGLYSLSLKPPAAVCDLELPTWSVLEKNRSLTVTEDMVIEYIGGTGEGGCVQGVGDVMKQLLLPPFRTSSSMPDSSMRTRDDGLMTVSIQGKVTSRSYRIDHMNLSRNTHGLPTHATNPCRIIALTVQSMESPDTINVYCEYRSGVPLPVGLIPGAVVTLNTFKIATSKSGNSYCKSTALSSIDTNSICDIKKEIDSTFQANLPVTYLRELSFLLLRGLLSKSIVCVRASYLNLIYLSFSYKCSCCQNIITNGKCMTACLRQKPFSQVTARFIIEDGSGSAHVYASGNLVQSCLRVAQSDWKEVWESVEKIGQVTYKKKDHQFQVTDDVVIDKSKLSLLDRAKYTMTEWASSPSMQRRFKLIGQPFVSSEEREQTIVGKKSYNFKLKGSDFSTLSLPRLQLRVMTLIELADRGGYVKECEEILRLLGEMEDAEGPEQ